MSVNVGGNNDLYDGPHPSGASLKWEDEGVRCSLKKFYPTGPSFTILYCAKHSIKQINNTAITPYMVRESTLLPTQAENWNCGMRDKPSLSFMEHEVIVKQGDGEGTMTLTQLNFQTEIEPHSV